MFYLELETLNQKAVLDSLVCQPLTRPSCIVDGASQKAQVLGLLRHVLSVQLLLHSSKQCTRIMPKQVQGAVMALSTLSNHNTPRLARVTESVATKLREVCL